MRISKKTIIGVVIAVVAVAALMLGSSMFEDANRSKNYVVQMPVSGNYHYWTEGGLQWQGFGNVYAYNKTSQIEFSDFSENESTGSFIASGENPAASTTFNDNGKGMIIGSFRVEIPKDENYLEKIQTDFGSEAALINTLVKPTLYKVVTACGPLMSSLESVSATRTDLTYYITDQLNSGIYKTKTEQIEVINEFTEKTEIRKQATILVDSTGSKMRQEISPFSKYGIRVGLVSIIDIKYDRATQNQIDAQKQANLAQITARTKSEEAKQRTIQITEEGKAAAEKAKWEQEKLKAIAVTKAQQEYEVAALEARKAEQVALKVEAEGKAKAAANRALVAAGLTPAEKAEWDYKTAVGVAEALAKSQVSWVPTIMLGAGDGKGGQSPMDAVGLKMLLDIAKTFTGGK